MKRLMLCTLLMASMALYAADDKKTTKKTTTTTKTSRNAGSPAMEDTVKKLERGMWEAWKNNDSKTFEEHLAPDALILGNPAAGFQDKESVVSGFSDAAQCKVNGFEFHNEKIIWINQDAAIYTYDATLDASCGNQKLPENLSASSVWVKRDSHWVSLFHQKTFAPPMKPEPALWK